jgi:hypothetical protein
VPTFTCNWGAFRPDRIVVRVSEAIAQLYNVYVEPPPVPEEVDEHELNPRPPRYNDRLLVHPAVRIRSSRHYFCFRGCAVVRCMVGCLLA